MGLLFYAALHQSQSKSPLQSGAAHRFVGRGRALTAMPFGRKEPVGDAMGFPERAQMLKGALWQRHVTIAIAFAGANVQQHPPGINVRNLQVQPFTQTQSAGINGDQRHLVVQNGDAAEDGANFLGREDDGQFELRLSARQLQFRRPNPPQGFLPKQFDGANRLGGSLARDLLDAF